MSEPSAEFVTLYTDCQSRLYAFLLSLMGDADQAREVLQETNLVIWRQNSDYVSGTNFMAWVFRIARFQAMAYRTKQRRDRLVFSDSAMEQIQQAFMAHDRDHDRRQHYLQRCLKLLAPNVRELVRQRYQFERSLQRIAEETGRSYQSVGQALRRARLALAKCIKQQEAGDA
ncbi:MAG: sigma-70 family RNA polymerase sigma factor [Phycisphaerales bacterium JB063]